MTTQHATDLGTDDATPGGTDTAARAGVIAALVGAIPVVGPALVAGCASCVGVGAAAGLGATSALPPTWWIAGLGVTALAVTALEYRTARRCARPPRTATTIATLLIVAALAWIATRYLFVPLVDWANGPNAPPVDGPVLP